MRPQQQGRRSRNRGGNRRNQNPLQRSYESNGPDVKIRGNAQVIADKYATLARDAQSSGDSVMAENYLQHAEHYNRIILAAQPQQQPRENDEEQPDAQSAENGQDRNARSDAAQRSDRQERQQGGDQPGGEQRTEATTAIDIGEQPQPVIDGTPAEVRQEVAEQEREPEKPKRARRPRKSTKAADADDVQTADNAPAEERADDQESAVAAE